MLWSRSRNCFWINLIKKSEFEKETVSIDELKAQRNPACVWRGVISSSLIFPKAHDWAAQELFTLIFSTHCPQHLRSKFVFHERGLISFYRLLDSSVKLLPGVSESPHPVPCSFTEMVVPSVPVGSWWPSGWMVYSPTPVLFAQLGTTWSEKCLSWESFLFT